MNPRTHAAGLFTAAFNTASHDHPTLTIAVHPPRGFSVHAVGSLQADHRPDFDPGDLSALLDQLTALLAQPRPEGVITVHVPPRAGHGGPYGWAWSITDDFTELRGQAAYDHLPAGLLGDPELPPGAPLRLDGAVTEPAPIAVTEQARAQLEQRGLRLHPTPHPTGSSPAH